MNRFQDGSLLEVARSGLTADLFVQVAAQKDGKAFDPLVHVDVRVVVAVEGAEDAVHENVVGHVERVVQYVAELEPIPAVYVLGNRLEYVDQSLDFGLADLKDRAPESDEGARVGNEQEEGRSAMGITYSAPS